MTTRPVGRSGSPASSWSLTRTKPISATSPCTSLKRLPRLTIDHLVPALEIARVPAGQRRLVAQGQRDRHQELAPLEQVAELALALGQRHSGLRRVLRQRREPREDRPRAGPGGLGFLLHAPHELVGGVLELLETAPAALQREQPLDHSPRA